MKLQFSLLLIDDNPDSIEQSLRTLSEHLDDKGFELAPETPRDISVDSVRELSRNQGKEFDLVAVDYMLGTESFDGGDVAFTIRQELQYTDMIFYSSNTALNLHERLVQAGVEGVFVAIRDELGEALVGLADTVIGKAVDLNHMRGIAMAEVAEMDVMMEETLAEAFRTAGSGLEAVARRTAERAKGSMTESAEQIEKVVADEGIAGLVRNALLFSSAQKYRALRRVCNSMSPRPDLGVLDSYERDVLGQRNMLAHAKETAADGTPTLESVTRDESTVTIDDAWMADFRRTLRDQRSALERACEAVRRNFP